MSAAATDSARTWLDLKITTGRYSSVLVQDIVAGYIGGDAVDVHAVFDAIGSLEGAPNTRAPQTRPPTRFRRAPLKGLWHKHFHHGTFRSLSLNLHSHWDGRLLPLVGKHFIVGETVAKEAIGRLVHEAVITGYEERARAGKITGEWIVFAKQDGINYYLTLGAHGDDDAIAKRARMCATEFPEVRVLERIAKTV